MIDMHLHTNYSDGTDTLIELLKKAEEKKLEYISITDHNTCKAYTELKTIDVKKYFNGNIIRGVELNTIVNGKSIELLGYGVNPNIINEEIEKICINKKDRNLLELKELISICENIGIKLEKNLEQQYDEKEECYASSYIHKHITSNVENRKFFLSDDSWNDPMVFYRKEMCNEKSKFHIDYTKLIPNIDKIIDLIKKAGGLVFVPHIYVYGNLSESIFKDITENYKVDGFECYYSKFTEEQTNFLVKYCKENNLYMSGGSDYHGKTKPNIDIGTGMNNNLNINKEIIMPWLDKVK